MIQDLRVHPYSQPDINEIAKECITHEKTALHKTIDYSGWPSFTKPIAKHVAKKLDFKMIIPRTEYTAPDTVVTRGTYLRMAHLHAENVGVTMGSRYNLFCTVIACHR